MTGDGRMDRTILVTVDSLRHDHYDAMPQTRAFLGETHPRVVSTANATLWSFQSIIGGEYPGEPGLDDGDSFVTAFADADVPAFGYQSNPLLTERYGYAQGFTEYSEPERSGGVKDIAATYMREGSLAHRLASTVYNAVQSASPARGDAEREYREAGDLVDAAINDVEELGDPEETEWFVWIHLMEPHHPYNPSPDFTDVPRGDAQRLSRKALAGRATDDDEQSVLRDLYRAEVEEADAALSRLWDWMPDDARVVFCADHGELLGGDDLGWGHFDLFRPELLHVPFATKNAPEPEGDVVSLVDVPSYLLGREWGEGTFGRALAYATNDDRTAVADGQTLVADDATYEMGDEDDDSSVGRLQRERSRFEARLENVALDGACEDDLRALGYR